MKHALWAIAVTAVLCVAAAIPWWRNRTERERADDRFVSLVRQSAAEKGDIVVLTLSKSQPRRQDGHALDRLPDYSAEFRAAPDYLEYVRTVLNAARAGDHAAQFYIFRAFDNCSDAYRLYFVRQGVRATLDDALTRAAGKGWPFDPEEVRRVYHRCSGLMESGKEFGNRNDWLRLASDGGYPLAQVLFARYQWVEARKTNSDEAAGREARRLLLAEAVRSRDPEVIFEVGAAPYVTVALDAEPAWDSNAWTIAACLRGLDCSPQSEIARMLCLYDRACQPYESVADILRRGNETEFPGIEDQAHWINEKIDTGDWEALGF